jgi:hypothetical protein
MLRALLGQTTCVRVVFDQGDYYGGETMSGRAILSVTDPGGVHVDAIYLRIRGREHTSFDAPRTRTRYVNGRSQTETYYVRVSANNTFHERNFVLYAQRATFLPGEYVFPFTLTLDAQLPATFRLPGTFAGAGDSQAALWYDAEAEIAVPGTFTPNIRSTQEFIVKDALKAPLAALTAHEERNVTFLCCFSRGTVVLHASLLKNAYGPGDAVQARILVDNTNSQVDLEKVSVKLVAEANLRAHSDVKNFGGTLAKTGTPGVPKGQRAERVVETVLPWDVPPSTTGRLISCAFCIMIELAVPWSPNVRMRIPVQIHAPPRVVQVVLPPDYVPTNTLPVVDLSHAPAAPPPSGSASPVAPPAYTPFAGSQPSPGK